MLFVGMCSVIERMYGVELYIIYNQICADNNHFWFKLI